MKAPAGQMRGPGTSPSSMPRFRPNTGPPMSRTLVKPRISVSSALRTAATLMKPISLVNATSCGTVATIMCTWASISPGISVRPSPAIRVTSLPAVISIGVVEMVVMVLPVTSTLDGADNRSDLPSKIRTFSNRMAWASSGCAESSSAPAVTERNLGMAMTCSSGSWDFFSSPFLAQPALRLNWP